MTDLNTTMSIIILNVKRICAPVKSRNLKAGLKARTKYMLSTIDTLSIQIQERWKKMQNVRMKNLKCF